MLGTGGFELFITPDTPCGTSKVAKTFLSISSSPPPAAPWELDSGSCGRPDGVAEAEASKNGFEVIEINEFRMSGVLRDKGVLVPPPERGA